MTDIASNDVRGEALPEFRAGVRAELPIALGVVPLGMIFGVLALAAELPPFAAQGMSSIVFAGSAQFIAVQLIAGATPAGIILLTTLIVNLRHLLYSASVAPHLQHLSPAWKWLLAYLLTDEAYVISILHFRNSRQKQSGQHWYMLGAGLTLWTSWQLSTALGVFLGAQIPSGWALDFTLALTFIGLVVPALEDRADVAAALVAGVVAVAAAGLPYQLGLVSAALAGISAGLVLSRRTLPRAS